MDNRNDEKDKESVTFELLEIAKRLKEQVNSRELSGDCYVAVIYVDVTDVYHEDVYEAVYSFKSDMDDMFRTLNVQTEVVILPVRNQKTELKLYSLMRNK